MIPAAFDHITPGRRAAAVRGFVAANPHQAGIEFDDIIDTLLDHDAHLAIVGDIPIDERAADDIVDHLANLALRPIDAAAYLPTLIDDTTPPTTTWSTP